MDVGVDESRQQHLVVGQHDHVRTAGVGVVRTDGDDDPVAETDGGGPFGTADDRAAGPHDGLRHGLPGHAQLPR